MSNPQPVSRRLLHTRAIELQGFIRDDGLFELEARLTDSKSYDSRRFPESTLPAGEPLHDMIVHMSFDEELLIHAFEAAMAATPYDGCREAEPNFGALVGMRIQPGFLREANRRLGGIKGCTHIRELLQQIATTAYQTVVGVRLQKQAETGAQPAEKPKLLDTCAGYRAGGEWVRVRWPEYYRPAGVDVDKPAHAGQATASSVPVEGS
jgi:hypothetical protein